MSEYALEMRGISKAFQGSQALQNVDFSAYNGEVHALIGENGAGKSTLMKILAGAYIPDNGEIFISGKPVVISSPIEAIKLGIGVIYQELNLIPYLSAIDNVMLGHERRNKLGFINLKMHRKEARKWLDELGENVIEDYNRPICNLSIAQQQMVEIAKALSLNASIIVMDEPSSTLTEKEINYLFGLINKLKQKGVTIIYISHRLEELFKITDRLTVLRDGQLITTVTTDSVDKGKLVSLMIGRELNNTFPVRENYIQDEYLLEVKHLFSGKLVKDISFNLRKGEILGISGLVGSGRTELARAIFGADSVDSGEIFFQGEKVNIKDPSHAVKLGIGLATEDRKSQGLFLDLSIKDNVSISSLDRISSVGFINVKQELEFILKCIEELNIKTSNNKKVKELSGGNQQKVVLARWLGTESKVLILDEPTRGIDVGAKYEIYCLMNKLVKRGIGIIMISSELPEIIGMSDRILVMYNGRITGEIDDKDLSEERIMWYATGHSSKPEIGRAI